MACSVSPVVIDDNCEVTRGTVRTMCPMNCHPTLCGMLAEVEQAAFDAAVEVVPA